MFDWFTKKKEEFSEVKTEADLDRLFEEASKAGAVLASMHFDAHSAKKEICTTSLVEFISRLSKEEGVLYCKGEIEEPIERGGEYSTSAEVKLMTVSFHILHFLCLRYSPIGVEVILPEKISMKLDEAHALLLDASQVSHEFSEFILSKSMSAEEKKLFDERMKWRAEVGKKLMEKKS